MITHNIPQRLDDGRENPDWLKLRIGIPTASQFEKIISPTGEASKQWEAYAHKILAEEMLGYAIEGYQSQAMLDGNAREAESIAFYEFQKDAVCSRIGFITDDARTMGCSPDALVGDDGILETKNPEAPTHVGYLLEGEKLKENIAKKYYPQIQGALLITGRKWIDIQTDFPGLPRQITRILPDEPYLGLMRKYLLEFSKRLAVKRARLVELGHLQRVA